MRQLSTDELVDLGSAFGIPVDDVEASAITEQVNGMLSELDALEQLAVSPETTVSERSWQPPADDPYNALVVECRVGGGDEADGILAGRRIGVKDIVAVAGIPMQCASSAMRGFIPERDAPVVERLVDAGATITAKTNLDELASSARGTTGFDGAVRNPVDPEHTAGGSSGGSAAAVATDRVDIAIGTDTGGSIRIPASFCGVIGYKPTYGLIPLTGVVENTYTQDHVGPLAGSIADVGRFLEAVAGSDDRDPASLQAAGREGYSVGGYVEAIEEPPSLSSVTIGVLDEGFDEGVAAPVEDTTRAAIEQLEDAGAEIRSVSIPEFTYGKAIKNVLSFSELAAHWRDGGAAYRRGGVIDESYQIGLADRTEAAGAELGAFYKSKLLAGARIIEGHAGRPYTRAQAGREVVRESVRSALDEVDVLGLPTMPDIAPRLEDADDPGFDYARNTRLANITRLPAITVSNGKVDGLPVGFQLMADAFEDAQLLGIAAQTLAQLD